MLEDCVRCEVLYRRNGSFDTRRRGGKNRRDSCARDKSVIPIARGRESIDAEDRENSILFKPFS